MLSTSPRAHHKQSPSTSSISKPMPVMHAHTTISPPTSPRGRPNKTRRPSVASPMTWLSRASSSASVQSVPYAPSRPVRISEPRFANPVEALTLPRTGVLGAGAMVVRTPQEALAGPRASASSPDLLARTRSPSPRQLAAREHEDRDYFDRPGSPPLPPIPDNDAEYIEEEQEDADEVDTETIDCHSTYMAATATVPGHPPAPTRPPPSLPSIPDYDSDLAALRATAHLRPTKSPLDFFPAVPPLPAGVVATPPQSPFSAILVSPVPNSSSDPSKIIVSLETSTATHRTTMTTLTSRPSHLASYLLGLFPSTESDTQSVYSTASDVDSSFNSIFNHHLASTGILVQSSSGLHIFLDRPSAPYAHILAYLRSPTATPDSSAFLPHGARLNGSACRVEALIELRDEAAYLGLEELQRLCADELRHRQPSPPAAAGLAGLGLHMRGLSNGSNKSLHTLREAVEPVEPVAKGAQRNSDDSGFASTTRKSGGSSELEAPWPSPPGLKERAALERSPKKDVHAATMKAKPTGAWI